MRIIKAGQAKKTIYRGTCDSCKAQVEFNRSEATFHSGHPMDQRDRGYWEGKCPTEKCGDSIILEEIEVLA